MLTCECLDADNRNTNKSMNSLPGSSSPPMTGSSALLLALLYKEENKCIVLHPQKIALSIFVGLNVYLSCTVSLFIKFIPSSYKSRK